MRFRAAFIVFLAAFVCFAQRLTKVTSVEGITEYRLENGLRLLVFPDASKPNITVNMTYLVGSRHEGAGEGGMAHLLEHMVFKGSPRHTNIPQELTEHGSRPNGTTSWDRTNYFETFQASDENLKWALDLESDRMVNSFIKQEDFDKEFSVVRNEFEAGQNNPFIVTLLHTMAAAYIAHTYGRPVIGNKSDVERVQDFYHKYYQPDNAVLMVAGKVDEPIVVALVSEYFGQIPRPSRKLNPTYTVEPVQDGERMTTVRRVGDAQALIAAYHIPDGSHADSAALKVLAGILTEQPSGRLYKALVDNKKAAEVFGFSLQLNEPGLMWLAALLNKTDSMDAARTAMLETIDGVVKEPPSKEEVDRARTRLMKDIDLNMQDSERIGLFISEWNAKGDWRLLFLNRDRLSQVKPEDVQRVAAAYLKASNRTIGEFIPDAKPDRAEVPARSDGAAAVKDYKSTTVLQAGEAFDASAQNIEARTERYTLPSGMKVALLAKKTRGASVHAVIRLRFGDADSLKGKDTVASMAAETLIRGTEHRNRQQIQDQIDRLKARLNVSGDAQGANVSIETNRENLPAVLRLAGEILKEASLPETEFEQIRKAEITSDEFSRAEPQEVASNRLRRAMYPFPMGDVRGTLSIDEEIAELKAVKLEDARAFHKKFYGASNGALAVVGDFDPGEVKKAVGELFGAWKSPSKFEKVKTGFQSVAPINETIETPDKANAVFVAAERINIGDHDADYPAMLFGNYMLGGGYLNSRLASRIRVKDGLSYGVGSQFSAKSGEKDGELQVFAIAAPQNVAKVEVAFKEELDRVLKDGFTQKEMDADRTGWLQSQHVRRAEDPSLTQILVTRDLDGRTLAWDEELEKKVTALTLDDVVAAFRRNIDVGRMSIVKAGDFKKAAGTK